MFYSNLLNINKKINRTFHMNDYKYNSNTIQIPIFSQILSSPHFLVKPYHLPKFRVHSGHDSYIPASKE